MGYNRENLIDDQQEVKNKDKDFILVSLSNPIQVNPKQIVSQYKEKNNIEDIFYPENRPRILQ